VPPPLGSGRADPVRAKDLNALEEALQDALLGPRLRIVVEAGQVGNLGDVNPAYDPASLVLDDPPAVELTLHARAPLRKLAKLRQQGFVWVLRRLIPRGYILSMICLRLVSYSSGVRCPWSRRRCSSSS
jgi:hypothetical protein